jgi:hypothetical protein
LNWRELNYQQYYGATAQERVAARKLLDAERVRLYNVDRETGSRLLLKWTQEIMEGFEMPDVEIEDGVEIPPEATTTTTPKRRGRRPGTTNKPPESAALLNAVEFVGVVETEAFEFSKYAALTNNAIVAYSNVLSAGHPIAEELNLCPQIDKLKAALSRCGKTLAITEATGHLSVKGDRLRALVPCLQEPLAPVQPDAPILIGDYDVLKEAFRVCCTVADEKADRPMLASLLLDPNCVSATNGQVLIQFWHGIANLPPGTVLPKVFAAAIANSKYKITGLGGNFDSQAGFMRSFTIWFENGAWLKTQCYEDRWQAIDHILNVATNPVAVYDGLFDAIAAVEAFTEGNSAVYFHAGTVASHRELEAGAAYEVKDLPAGKVIHGRLARQVSPFIKQIDLMTMADRVFFFGGSDNNPIRGVFMGMAGSQ